MRSTKASTVNVSRPVQPANGPTSRRRSPASPTTAASSPPSSRNAVVSVIEGPYRDRRSLPARAGPVPRGRLLVVPAGVRRRRPRGHRTTPGPLSRRAERARHPAGRHPGRAGADRASAPALRQPERLPRRVRRRAGGRAPHRHHDRRLRRRSGPLPRSRLRAGHRARLGDGSGLLRRHDVRPGVDDRGRRALRCPRPVAGRHGAGLRVVGRHRPDPSGRCTVSAPGEELHARWERFCDELKVLGADLGRPSTPDDELTVAEGIRHLTRLVRMGLETSVESLGPSHPALTQIVDDTKKFGCDNPDTIYLSAALDGGGTYRITGRRGTVDYLSFTTSAGGRGAARRTGFLDSSSLVVGDDGTVDICVSATPAHGNWLAIEPDTNGLGVR